MAVTLAGVGAQVVSVSGNELHVLSGAYDPQGRCGNNSGAITVTDIECATMAEVTCRGLDLHLPRAVHLRHHPHQRPGDHAGDHLRPGIHPAAVFLATRTPPSTPFSRLHHDLRARPHLPRALRPPGLHDAGLPGTQLVTPVDIRVRSLYTGCTYTFKSFFVPVSTACLLPPPTCASRHYDQHLLRHFPRRTRSVAPATPGLTTRPP